MNNYDGPGRTMPYTNAISTAGTLAANSIIMADGISAAGVIAEDIADSATGTAQLEGVFGVTASAVAAFTIGLTNCKVDGNGKLLLNSGTGVPNTACSNLRVYEQNTATTTIKVKLLG